MRSAGVLFRNLHAWKETIVTKGVSTENNIGGNERVESWRAWYNKKPRHTMRSL